MITQEEKYGLDHGLVKGVPTTDAVSKWTGRTATESAHAVGTSRPHPSGNPGGSSQPHHPFGSWPIRELGGPGQYTGVEAMYDDGPMMGRRDPGGRRPGSNAAARTVGFGGKRMAQRTEKGNLPQLEVQPYHLRPPRDPHPITPRVTVPPSVALVLERLDGAADGVGSGTLQLYLRDHGISASQPTVGRILRELDHDGLTVKVSNRGRVLTEKGRARLELLRFENTRHQWAEGLLRNVAPPSRADFLPILEALALIEGEIARLAAERATDEQIKEMQAVVEEQRKNLENPMRGAQQGTDFHHLLGNASGNRFLQLAKKMLWDVNRALQDLWYEANIVTGTSSYPAHLRLAQAMAAHDPRAAQRAMRDHFDVFARAVKQHLQRISTTEGVATVISSRRSHRSNDPRKPL